MLQTYEHAKSTEGRFRWSGSDPLTDQSERTGPMAKTDSITVERVRNLFHYDPLVGHLTWKKRQSPSIRIGDLAGQRSVDKHAQVQIDGVLCYVHRVIWAWKTGSWPKEKIDHRDLDFTNHRWSNLREATHSQNKANMRKRGDNTSGFKGVIRDRHRWRALIGVRGVRYNLGTFDTREEAFAAYKAAAIKHFGSFARWD